MQQLTFIIPLILALAGCAATSEDIDRVTMYPSPEAAFVYKFVGASDYYDVPRSIEYLTQQERMHKLDLNEDGIDECIIEPAAMIRANGEGDSLVGATGNRTIYLLRQHESGWVVIGDLSGIGKNEFLQHRVDGWPDIATSNNAGQYSSNTVHRWNGSSYVEFETVRYFTPGH